MKPGVVYTVLLLIAVVAAGIVAFMPLRKRPRRVDLIALSLASAFGAFLVRSL